MPKYTGCRNLYGPLKPEGGIKLEDGRVLPDGYYVKYEDDWGGGKAWKVYTHDDALVGYDKSNKEWALNQAWQRVARGDIPNPKHKKLSSFAEADPNKLRGLLGQKELFYRVHGKNEKFHKDLAFSSIIDGSNKRKGYSSYDNPEDLIDYWSGNNPSNRSISDDAEVVIYSGKKVGKGGDNEPLSVPDMKVVYRTTWKKLLSAVELNPNQSRPPEKGGKTRFRKSDIISDNLSATQTKVETPEEYLARGGGDTEGHREASRGVVA